MFSIDFLKMIFFPYGEMEKKSVISVERAGESFQSALKQWTRNIVVRAFSTVIIIAYVMFTVVATDLVIC